MWLALNMLIQWQNIKTMVQSVMYTRPPPLLNNNENRVENKKDLKFKISFRLIQFSKRSNKMEFTMKFIQFFFRKRQKVKKVIELFNLNIAWNFGQVRKRLNLAHRIIFLIFSRYIKIKHIDQKKNLNELFLRVWNFDSNNQRKRPNSDGVYIAQVCI